ncbi:DUF1178 family protein [Loktanella sp. R86503]|uniref:DUF1178 family protein n=1 Tax=Loktanella TaxID=245186 RepID=UPI0036D956C7
MIRYTLICDNDHRFDSWFQSADAFTTLAASGQLTCTTCGSAKVSKTVMAPAVAADRHKQAAVQKLRQHIESNAEDVGADFAREARAMHLGDAPERAIWGEATGADVRALLADDIPVLPLPFVPRRRTN